MPTDAFTEQLAKVRQRYVSTLQAKIDDTSAALPRFCSDAAGAVDAVAEAYRRIHGISGVGPTVGFVETGKAARATEAVLITPYRERRALTSEEAARLEVALVHLRAIARREIDAVAGRR